VTLRVLHCIYDDPSNPWVAGGGAVRVRELYRHLAGEVEATVLTGNHPGAADETVDGIRYRRLGAASPYAWSRLTYALAAMRALRAEPYDAAVFDHSAYTPILVPRDRPVGITVHHLTGPTARERWGALGGAALARFERSMLRRARDLSATSSSTRDELRALLGPAARIHLVTAGVDDRLFSLERREAEYVLYFGRLDWIQKGLDTLFDAFAALSAERPELRLKAAGRGKDLDRAVARADALGIRDRVEFLGAVSDEERERLFAGARVLLMPSRFEGFGMVAAEAMAAGVPIVATAGGALPEVIAPPEGGRVVPVGDARALAAAAALLLEDPAEREALSRSARRSAERFRWQAVARDHLAFLHAIREDARGPNP
jgi:glycosyltransferase involved in cell wall biosynthesis